MYKRQEETHHRGLVVLGTGPTESVAVEVAPVQCGHGADHGVQIGHPAGHTGVRRLLPQVPVEGGVLVTLALLGELTTHEEQLLARVRPHQPQHGAQPGEALPVVARLFVEQAALAMHHFVV